MYKYIYICYKGIQKWQTTNNNQKSEYNVYILKETLYTYVYKEKTRIYKKKKTYNILNIKNIRNTCTYINIHTSTKYNQYIICNM